jgi:signal transduction histidine kinase
MEVEALHSLRRLRDGLSTVRARTTAAAVVVVGVALVAGAIALVGTLRSSLERDVEIAARLRAEDVAAALEEGARPGMLALGDGDDSFVQIVDRSGTVIAASEKVAGLPPVVSLTGGEGRTIAGVAGEGDDSFVVISTSAEGAEGRLTVLVGRSLDPVEESGAIVARVLVLGIPLLLAVVALTARTVVGRALRSVESIRSQVAEISTSELHRRVTEPPGQDEIARLAQTMNEMLARLEREQQRQRSFISDASHELRSPVATIRNQSEVALAHPETTGVEELASDVLIEDLRLQGLVEDLLFLARGDEERRPLNPRPVDLDDIVLDEARRLRDGSALDVDTTAVSGGRTLADSTQLRRAVRNLADNAARHASSRVEFTVREEIDCVVLLVDDDGPGVSPEDRDTVFLRFARLDHARDRDHGGSGLGLAIVHESISAHGGSISVSDAPLGGARFEVRLPAVR